MLAANIFAGFVLIVWGGLLWLGIGLMKGVAAQHLAGYPNAAQTRLWIDGPIIMVALLLLAFASLNFVKRTPRLLAALAAAALVTVFLYLVVLCYAAAA